MKLFSCLNQWIKMDPTNKRYLLYLINEHLEFRIPEIESVAAMVHASVNWIEKSSSDPFVLVESTEADIKKLLSRCIMIRSAIELWADATNRQELFNQIKVNDLIKNPQFCGPDRSFRVMVEAFGKKLSQKEQVCKIEELAFMDFMGPIKLKNPDNDFYFIEYYGTDPNKIPETPFRFFFGRWIGDGQKRLVHNLALRDRTFISNTSMDPALSLLMANIAQVKNNDIVYDPFVGSGSILCAAATFGGYVLGSDIDYKLLYGLSRPTRPGIKERKPDESIYANLDQYNVASKYLDAVVADSSLPLWRKAAHFDAIITDPPYGLREASLKIGSQKKYKVPEECLQNHIPSKIRYTYKNILDDLLDFATVYLKINGRLVYWVPQLKTRRLTITDSVEDQLIQHPCFSLVYKCEQVFRSASSRLLICMEKVKEPDTIKTIKYQHSSDQ